MKFFSSPLSLAAAVLSIDLLATVSADFHVGSLRYNGWPNYGACPSNYYNCSCFRIGDRKASVQLQSGSTLLGSYFSVNGLCGMGKLDFYKRSDGHWDFYKSGGTGAIEGQCWGTSDEVECLGDTVVWVDQLVCYSYICN